MLEIILFSMPPTHLQEFHLITEYFKIVAEHNFLKELLKDTLTEFSDRKSVV